MKVVYEKPREDQYLMRKWFDDNGEFNIWYEEVINLYNYQSLDIPNELKRFLDKWNNKMKEYKKDFVEKYPVKLAQIEFIYNDEVYSLKPSVISATYKTSFMADEEYECSWDSLFEEYQKDIREDLEKELGVAHSRYFGMLD